MSASAYLFLDIDGFLIDQNRANGGENYKFWRKISTKELVICYTISDSSSVFVYQRTPDKKLFIVWYGNGNHKWVDKSIKTLDDFKSAFELKKLQAEFDRSLDFAV